MKTINLLIVLVIGAFMASSAQQFKIITVVESIVPAGIGRSRIIEHTNGVNASDFTTDKLAGKKSKQGNIKRKSLKAIGIKETKLLNFYSIVGINFRNIASNDASISSKINEMTEEGWDLVFVTSGVESNGGTEDMNGIFITRLFFKGSGKKVDIRE